MKISQKSLELIIVLTDILSSLHQPLLDKPNKRSTLNSVVNKNPSFDMILKSSISQFSL